MSVSVFDLFKIGVGPSSSHTVGPMIAARQFACHVRDTVGLAAVHHVTIELFGSLSATGVGHGTDKAVLLGLAGHEPDHIDPDQIQPAIADIRIRQTLELLGEHMVPFVEKEHLLFRRKSLPLHPNGMAFHAFDAQGNEIAAREYYSVGGGFVIDAAGERVLNSAATAGPDAAGHAQGLPHPFRTGAELLAQCQATGLTPAQLMAANEQHWRSASEVRRQLMAIWQTMASAVQRGCASTAVRACSSSSCKAMGCHCMGVRAARARASRPSSMPPMRRADWSMVCRKPRASCSSCGEGAACDSSSSTRGPKDSTWRSGARRSCDTACSHSCCAARRACSSCSRWARRSSASCSVRGGPCRSAAGSGGGWAKGSVMA